MHHKIRIIGGKRDGEEHTVVFRGMLHLKPTPELSEEDKTVINYVEELFEIYALSEDHVFLARGVNETLDK